MTSTVKKIGSVSYEVRELMLGDVEDLLGKEGVNFSVEIFKRAVMVDGKPVGQTATTIPLRHYATLAKLVNAMNATDDSAGND